MENNTLTLHHISHYLPYKLKCLVLNDGEKGEHTLNAVYANDWNNTPECVFHGLVESAQGFGEVKPLLYSLDDYADYSKCEKLGLPFDVGHLANGLLKVQQCSYAAIQAMAEAHIDMFRLIDSGLAVRKEPLK